MEFRRYCPADYEAVCDFLIRLNKEERSCINWNWARFEWMYAHPEFDAGLISSIGLWQDKGRLVGAAIYDMYFGEAFCGVLPEYRSLYPQVLDYAWREMKDEAGLAVSVCDGNAGAIGALEAAGFHPEAQRETVMRLSLDRLEQRPLPEGFSPAELDPVHQAFDFQWLLWQGFDHGTDPEEFVREDPIVPRFRPHLDGRLSLTAVAPDGGKAAYCCVWYYPGTDYAYVEPVCTVPAHRGRGLAAAILSQALQRAKALGAKDAYVISDLGFYEKLGFETDRTYTFYRKP